MMLIIVTNNNIDNNKFKINKIFNRYNHYLGQIFQVYAIHFYMLK